MSRPTTRVINWLDEVRRSWGEEWNVPETCYQFTGGRKFKSTDRSQSGVYGVPVFGGLLVEPVPGPLDMHMGTLLMEDGGELGQE